MRRLAGIVIVAAVLGSVASASAGLVDPALDARLREAAPDEIVSTLVYLASQEDLAALTDVMDEEQATLARRHEVVLRSLQGLAAHEQGDLLDHLDGQTRRGRVRGYQPFWIVNAVRVDAIPAAILAIAERADVDRVYLNYEIEGIEPVVEAAGKGGEILSAGGITSGVQAVRAPQVWDMGITGAGVLVATLDTGVDGMHEALETRWRGRDARYDGHPEWAWFDPVTNTDFPRAFGSHGTHTMGSVCGGAPGEQIGVAPGAEWIHAAVIDRVGLDQTVADAILSFEWIVDPDDDPGTSFDVPDVCSNSWGLRTSHGYLECDETFWTFLDAAEAAGIVILFAAGNEGSEGLRRPADRATDDFRTAAVAAVDATVGGWPIASFSSRGPTLCTPDGSAAIKPDIAAPGVDVLSSRPNDNYGTSSGTSMATPHVNGVVALLRQADPELSVERIKQIIYDTAFDLGQGGEDNAYGWGMVDAFAAVEMALAAGLDGDVDGDGDVDFDDLLLLLAAWGPCDGCPEDVNGDGDVDFADVVILLSNWT